MTVAKRSHTGKIAQSTRPHERGTDSERTKDPLVEKIRKWFSCGARRCERGEVVSEAAVLECGFGSRCERRPLRLEYRQERLGRADLARPDERIEVVIVQNRQTRAVREQMPERDLRIRELRQEALRRGVEIENSLGVEHDEQRRRERLRERGRVGRGLGRKQYLLLDVCESESFLPDDVMAVADDYCSIEEISKVQIAEQGVEPMTNVAIRGRRATRSGKQYDQRNADRTEVTHAHMVTGGGVRLYPLSPASSCRDVSRIAVRSGSMDFLKKQSYRLLETP
ncbi:MAG: hypothetical protein QOK37_4601 [Thermoanaerobaculia bacterium]|nr:hypothetical protein [Thermoanaerobaculia bacterium]